MTKSTTLAVPPAEVGRRLEEARKEKDLTPDDVLVELRLMGLRRDQVMSRGKLLLLEKGATKKPNPIDVALLAAVYGKTLRDISPDLADDLDQIGELVFLRPEGGSGPGSPCIPDGPAGGRLLGLTAA